MYSSPQSLHECNKEKMLSHTKSSNFVHMDCTQTGPSFLHHIANQVLMPVPSVNWFVSGQGIKVGCVSEQLSASHCMEFAENFHTLNHVIELGSRTLEAFSPGTTTCIILPLRHKSQTSLLSQTHVVLSSFLEFHLLFSSPTMQPCPFVSLSLESYKDGSFVHMDNRTGPSLCDKT